MTSATGQLREARVLVVDDNDALRHAIAVALREAWSDVQEVSTGSEAISRIADARAMPFDVVLTDLRLPGADGVSVLKAARRRDESTSVVLMTAYGSIDTAVQAMKDGAFDFIQKPLDLEQIELRVAKGVESSKLQGEARELRAGRNASAEIIGDSPALRAAVDLARRVAPTRSTVLITGETGTGKEQIAGLMHTASRRADGPFVKVNCAALPETLLESELFGHERGSFTGADRQRTGRFEEASGGTLFLDEIGEMSPVTQAKLLRVLQDQEFHRLGGTVMLRTDARIVSATNSDLEALIREGRFREDLFFRLNVIRLHLPPLRERPEDTIALAHHFLRDIAAELDRQISGFSAGALERIRGAMWRGNIRELRNTIERAVLMAEGTRIDAQDLTLCDAPSSALSIAGSELGRSVLPSGGLSLRDAERELVLAALRRSGFVQKDAAVLLGISRRKLNYMIQRMGIVHAAWRRNRGEDRGAGAESDEASDSSRREGVSRP